MRRIAPTPARLFVTRCAVAVGLAFGIFACSGADTSADNSDGEDTYASTNEDLQTAGPCAGMPIDHAVKCAQAKGARVLSYYRSPAEQERVRRENGCVNRCTGQEGCIRPTANCDTSPHTRCHAVDLVGDGAPLSRAQLRACHLAKTTAPHANHYDLVN
jgi:hypothetical protein